MNGSAINNLLELYWQLDSIHLLGLTERIPRDRMTNYIGQINQIHHQLKRVRNLGLFPMTVAEENLLNLEHIELNKRLLNDALKGLQMHKN